MADRFTYLPQIGVLVALVWLIPDLVPHRHCREKALPLLAAAVCVSLAVLTERQLGTMKDDESLYRQMLVVNPSDQRTARSLGLLLLRSGRIDEGTTLLRGVAYRLGPRQLASALLETAGDHSLEGRPDRALESFTRILLLDPGNPVALQAITRLKAKGARLPQSAPSSLTVEELVDEQVAVYWFREANAVADSGHCESALNRYRQALAVKPDFADAWNNLGSCYGALHRVEAAAEAFEKALLADPGHQQARQNLAQARRLLEP